MIKTTLNGKDIIIEHDEETNKYIIYYDGEISESDERPITDQDVEQDQLRMIEELIRIRKEIMNIRIKFCVNCLVDLLSPLLEN